MNHPPTPQRHLFPIINKGAPTYRAYLDTRSYNQIKGLAPPCKTDVAVLQSWGKHANVELRSEEVKQMWESWLPVFCWLLPLHNASYRLLVFYLFFPMLLGFWSYNRNVSTSRDRQPGALLTLLNGGQKLVIDQQLSSRQLSYLSQKK